MPQNKIKTTFTQKALLILFSLVIIEVFLRIIGLSYAYFQKPTSPTLTHETNEKVILCIGESTTAWGGGESYPAQLQKILDQYTTKQKYVVINEGAAATNTGKILDTLEFKINTYKPDIVISMMGINDFWGLSQSVSFLDNIKLYNFFKILFVNLQNSIKKKTPPPTPPPALQNRTVLPPIKPIVYSEDYIKLYSEAMHELQNKNLIIAKKLLLQASKAKIFNSEVFIIIGKIELDLGNFKAAEAYFSKYVGIEKTAKAYSRVGELYYMNFGVFHVYGQSQARKYFEESLKLDPLESRALILLGCSYLNLDKQIDKALGYLERAYALKMQDSALAGSLADIYLLKEREKDAEEILKNNLIDYVIWSRLINLYKKQKRIELAEKTLNEALEQYPDNQSFLNIKAELLQQSKFYFILKYFNSTYNTANYFDFPATQVNYKKMAKILKDQNIIHIVMQYPRRPIDEIKKVIEPSSNTYFVDNQKTFEDLLLTKKYEDLFIDSFAENFGHTTALGSQTIAQQVFLTLKNNNLIK